MDHVPGSHQRQARTTALAVVGLALVVALISACSPDVTVVIAPTTTATSSSTDASETPLPPSSSGPETVDSSGAPLESATPPSTPAAATTTGVLEPGATAAPTAAPGTPTTIVGSGVLVDRPFPLDGFQAISAANGFRVVVTVADTFSVIVTADDNALDRLDIRVDGGTLVLGVLPQTSLEDVSLAATVTIPALDGLSASGGSIVTAAGGCANLEISLAGGSELDAVALACRAVDADLAGGSRADVTASDAVSADLSGGSELTYGGGASALSLSTSGGSSARSR